MAQHGTRCNCALRERDDRIHTRRTARRREARDHGGDREDHGHHAEYRRIKWANAVKLRRDDAAQRHGAGEADRQADEHQHDAFLQHEP